MADAAFFQNCWIISNPPTSRAYPRGRWVSIGKDPDLADRFAVSWLDADGILHVLRQLQLTGGKLVGPAVEVGPNTRWTVTIERVVGTQNITGTVAGPLRVKKDPFVEATLAGTWGADAPPPPFDDDPRP
jgi:hypothetical protein